MLHVKKNSMNKDIDVFVHKDIMASNVIWVSQEGLYNAKLW